MTFVTLKRVLRDALWRTRPAQRLSQFATCGDRIRIHLAISDANEDA
jgi:hypothetical protein